jgi:hypothetical protein
MDERDLLKHNRAAVDERDSTTSPSNPGDVKSRIASWTGSTKDIIAVHTSQPGFSYGKYVKIVVNNVILDESTAVA